MIRFQCRRDPSSQIAAIASCCVPCTHKFSKAAAHNLLVCASAIRFQKVLSFCFSTATANHAPRASLLRRFPTLVIIRRSFLRFVARVRHCLNPATLVFLILACFVRVQRSLDLRFCTQKMYHRSHATAEALRSQRDQIRHAITCKIRSRSNRSSQAWKLIRRQRLNIRPAIFEQVRLALCCSPAQAHQPANPAAALLCVHRHMILSQMAFPRHCCLACSIQDPSALLSPRLASCSTSLRSILRCNVYTCQVARLLHSILLNMRVIMAVVLRRKVFLSLQHILHFDVISLRNRRAALEVAI